MRAGRAQDDGAPVFSVDSKQPYGKRSKDYLAGLVFGEIVDVTPMGTDRYGCPIALRRPLSHRVSAAETCSSNEPAKAIRNAHNTLCLGSSG